ncbi:OmpA family protein [Pleomorphovibrio marinus]|uniref:OmpA family protein n=1 Tax=Pleomorphovibrio marinus TaxID=2164132 RepID=UPI000E0AC05C|nr:OmpA family protein [Pleomorphovibrio marinus]
MKKAVLIWGFLMVLLVNGLFAQEYSIIDRRAIKFFEDGEQFLLRRQLDEAMANFQAAYERSSDFFEAYLRHSQVLLTKGLHQQSLEIAEKGERRVKPNKEVPFKGRFGWLIVQVYLGMGEFEKAIEKLEESSAYMDDSFKASDSYRKSKEQLDFISTHLSEPLAITKERLEEPLNRFRLQYFPVLTADSKKILFTKRDGLQNQDNEDIYVSYYDGESWTEPQSISQAINTRYNEGTCTISADGNILIFTSCDTPDSFGSCDLYLTQRVNGVWQKPANMGKNVNSRYWDSQPSLSADGSVLFFSSNRREGHGGNDIWFTERLSGGGWSEARNLGENVNTPKDEVSPFIFFNNEMLFFASDGHMGFGGKDIFVSKFDGKEFGPPMNLGYPINDHNDQLALFITAQKDYAYYTQNAFIEGKPDSSFLYRFKFPESIDLGEKILVTEGRVLDAKSGKPVDAKLSLVNLSNDSTMYEFRSDGKTGDFVMLYPDKGISGLYVEKKGFLPRIYNVERDSLKNRKNLSIELEPVESGKNFVFENIFFDFDKADLKPESISSLSRLMKFLQEHPEVNILIEGHTDNVGGSSYNENLSLKRALAVKEYLMKLGIGENRLETVGRGDKKPLKDNETEENRALNRRIEVIIL